MIRLRQIKIDVSKKQNNILKKAIAKKLNISINDITYLNVIKRSIDARSKPNIYYSYIVDIKVKNEQKILKKFNNDPDVFKVLESEYKFTSFGSVELNNRPVIVGCGPCGLICGYMLAQNGYNPLIIERGWDVDTRTKDVENFWKTGIIKLNSNVQFGEGGAGTFSDGKLNTLIKDKNNYHKKVFEILVENGAPKEIMYENMPHIGTDLLKNIVKNIRKKIIKMGGEVRFNTCLTDINIKDDNLESITVNNNEILPCNILVLAIGHSARDTFKMLYDKKIKMEAKPFAVGIRIEHPQEMINMSQYGVEEHEILKSASYKLTHKASNGRGVYTFCMCPGGYVVNASSEKGHLCVNGMSNYNRDSGVANSAVVVTITPADFGTNPLDGIKFQRKLESRAFNLASGKIPVSLFKDYKENKVSSCFKDVNPTFKGNYSFANINDIFPSYINESLKEGILAFDKKIKGFAINDAIIAAPEARTSSPVRILRDEFGISNVSGIYPCGEGAGYAGGITSAAIDGLITFEKIASIYRNINN